MPKEIMKLPITRRHRFDILENCQLHILTNNVRFSTDILVHNAEASCGFTRQIIRHDFY